MLLTFLLLGSDMEIAEKQVLRIFSSVPLFISFQFLTLRLLILSSLTPISARFGAFFLGTDINLSRYKTICEQALRFYCDIPLAVAVVILIAFQSDESFVA